MTVAVILGSAFVEPVIGARALEPVSVDTRFGAALLHRYPRDGGEAYLVFRHGVPHGLLPNQVPYRANALALQQVGCDALLVTSSVGVLDRSLPLDTPIPVADVLMPDNRLETGAMAESLETGRRAIEALALAFLDHGEAVPFGNRFYRYPGSGA